MRPDVIVTGTGRSGTSTVARILHTRLDVCMGANFRDLSDVRETNPQGEWEDTDVALASRRLVGGYPEPDVSRVGPLLICKWQRAFDNAHRNCKSELKGVKSPHLSALDRDGWRKLNPRLIIRTWRPRKLVVASMLRCRGGERKTWERFFDVREQRMAECIPHEIPTTMVCFHKQLDDDVIAAYLAPAVDSMM